MSKLKLQFIKMKKSLKEIWMSSISIPGFKVFASNEGYSEIEIKEFIKSKKSK